MPTPQQSADVTGCATAEAIAERDSSFQGSLLNYGSNAELLASRSELARDLHVIVAGTSGAVRQAVGDLAARFDAAVAYTNANPDSYSALSPITSTNIFDARKRVATVCAALANALS